MAHDKPADKDDGPDFPSFQVGFNPVDGGVAGGDAVAAVGVGHYPGEEGADGEHPQQSRAVDAAGFNHRRDAARTDGKAQTEQPGPDEGDPTEDAFEKCCH